MFSLRSVKMMTINFVCVLFVCLLIFFFPQQGLHAALLGLSIWWDILFPALFPFFVVSELLIGFGIVHFMGTLLDPLMRPLFRIPGSGGFVMAMGLVSGYPVGARLTAQLWEQKLLTREEGERLIAFTTTSDPIFLIGAVAIGFFHHAEIAAILALSHYGAGFIIGWLMRFHGRKVEQQSMPPTDQQTEQHSMLTAFPKTVAAQSLLGKRHTLLSSALLAMHRARLNDGRPIGLLIKQAITASLQLVFTIGALVVFFAVIIELLSLTGILSLCYAVMQAWLSLCGIPPIYAEAIVNGVFEVTLGAKFAGAAHGPLIHSVAIASFVLSWGGLSVHAQIVSLINHTTLRYTPFFIARLLHAFTAALFVYILWGIMI